MIWIDNVPAVAADMLHASWEDMASFMGIG